MFGLDLEEYNNLLFIGLKRNRNNIKDNTQNNHYDIYNSANLIRKFKKLFINILIDYVNDIISKIYSKNIGVGIKKKKILKITLPNNNKDNKELLHTTLGDIFSNYISKKYTFYLVNFNRNLIQMLLNEEDENKKQKFINLFNKTFLECLEHFRGTKNINGLEGLEIKYNNLINDLEKKDYNNEYIFEIINVIYNYEKFIENQKIRIRRNDKK